MTSADGLATCRQNEGSLLRHLCLHHIDPLLQLLHIRFFDPLTGSIAQSSSKIEQFILNPLQLFI